jgi:hypothetical protein
MNCRFLLPALLLLGPVLAGDLEAQSLQAQQPPAPAEEPAKDQPPPLFPKHQRGIYKDNQDIEVIDATPQSPPLEIDDPGVPDKGAYEINLISDGDLSKDERKLDLLYADLNYGVLPKIMGHDVPTQLKLEFPFSGLKANGEPYAFGVGGATLGIKFNYRNDEHTGVSMAVYPQLEFAVAGSAGKGLTEPGQTLELPWLVSKQLSHATLVLNSGLEQPFHDPNRRTTGTLGFGLGRALMRKFAVMADIHGESAFDFKKQRQVGWNAGVMYGVRHVPVYARIGRSLLADDGATHTYFTVGIKLISEPMHGGH